MVRTRRGKDKQKSPEYFYIDDSGEKRGPYTATQMDEWYHKEYFPTNLIIICGKENGDCTTMGELVEKNGSTSPFQKKERAPEVSLGTAENGDFEKRVKTSREEKEELRKKEEMNLDKEKHQKETEKLTSEVEQLKAADSKCVVHSKGSDCDTLKNQLQLALSQIVSLGAKVESATTVLEEREKENKKLEEKLEKLEKSLKEAEYEKAVLSRKVEIGQNLIGMLRFDNIKKSGGEESPEQTQTGSQLDECRQEISNLRQKNLMTDRLCNYLGAERCQECMIRTFEDAYQSMLKHNPDPGCDPGILRNKLREAREYFKDWNFAEGQDTVLHESKEELRRLKDYVVAEWAHEAHICTSEDAFRAFCDFYKLKDSKCSEIVMREKHREYRESIIKQNIEKYSKHQGKSTTKGNHKPTIQSMEEELANTTRGLIEMKRDRDELKGMTSYLAAEWYNACGISSKETVFQAFKQYYKMVSPTSTDSETRESWNICREALMNDEKMWNFDVNPPEVAETGTVETAKRNSWWWWA